MSDVVKSFRSRRTLLDKQSTDKNDIIFCTKCGWENPRDARYCASCGFFLTRPDDISSEKAPKKTDTDIRRPGSEETISYDDEKYSHQCPRCRSNIRDLDQCPLCGLRAPEPEDTPDFFFSEFMLSFPTLLVNPEKFVDRQPYYLGWIALIRPVLWSTLFAIIAWIMLTAIIGGSLQREIRPDMPLWIFLLLSMAAIVLIVPWCILLYVSLVQLAAKVVGGHGQIERAYKALCMMLSGLFIILATLLILHNYAKNLILMDPFFLVESKWRDDFLRIPLILKLIIFFVQIYFLHLQIRIVARINYIGIDKSVLAHIILAVPILVYLLLQHYGYA